MTRTIPINGAKRLYEEDVSLRDSPAFNWIMPIVGKILAGIGIGIDKGLDALGIGRYFKTPEKGQEQTGYQTREPQKDPAPAMASGYKIALAMQAIPSPTAYRNGFNSGYRTGRCAA